MQRTLTRRSLLKKTGLGAGALAAWRCGLAAAAPKRKPNIVFVLADDLGWMDVGYNGAKFYETPNIDRLAKEGMIFTNGYSGGPNCAPTRACIISGMYTPRHHIYTPGGASKGSVKYMKLKVPAQGRPGNAGTIPSLQALKPKTVSIAEVLKQAGYVTARFGKWHVGPDKQGFDVSGSDGTPGKEGKHYGSPTVADKLTDAGVAFIEKNRTRPFLLYLTHWDVHTPIRAKAEVVKRYQAKLKDFPGKLNPTYAGMIEAVDKSVGRLRAKLRKAGLEDNTLLIFSSDNGGVPGITSNRPLKGGKGSLFEGGIRVPTCCAWPGVVGPGTRCDVPITSVDFLPTFADIGGAPLPTTQPVDGESIVPLLTGTGQLKRKSIFWHYPLYLQAGKGAAARVLPIAGTGKLYWRAVPASAIRKGDWKLILYYEDNSVKLFNISFDIGETKDLAGANPEKAAELLAELKAWLAETRAPIPTKPNPDFEPPK